MKRKIDNSFLSQKISLRVDALPKKRKIKVLDCYSGQGTLYEQVKKMTAKDIEVVSIDKKPNNHIDFVGNNIKYLKSLDLSIFDIIDLDAYGVPFKQLEIIFDRQYFGIVIVTFIQSILRSLPKDMLILIGYTEEMIRKCPVIMSKNGMRKMSGYLALKGVNTIYGYFMPNCKNYFYFDLK
jgi:hypothetical protein